MGNSEEFDWSRMRREERDYWATNETRKNPPKPISVLARIVADQIGIDIEVCRESQARISKLRSMPYDEYLQSDHWIALRKLRIEFDETRCVNCGAQQNLQVHHKTYINRGAERLDDLETLCVLCHKLKHPEK